MRFLLLITYLFNAIIEIECTRFLDIDIPDGSLVHELFDSVISNSNTDTHLPEVSNNCVVSTDSSNVNNSNDDKNDAISISANNENESLSNENNSNDDENDAIDTSDDSENESLSNENNSNDDKNDAISISANNENESLSNENNSNDDKNDAIDTSDDSENESLSNENNSNENTDSNEDEDLTIALNRNNILLNLIRLLQINILIRQNMINQILNDINNLMINSLYNNEATVNPAVNSIILNRTGERSYSDLFCDEDCLKDVFFMSVALNYITVSKFSNKK